MGRSILFCALLISFLAVLPPKGVWGQTAPPLIPLDLPEHAYVVRRHSLYFYGTLRTEPTGAHPHLYRMDFATSEVARVLSDDAENSALRGQCVYLAANRDGSTLALVAAEVGTTSRTSRIVSVDTRTCAIRELVANNLWNNYPCFSPDGLQIAFCRQTPQESAVLPDKSCVPVVLSVADLNTGAVRDLVEIIRRRSDDSEPAWSPTGQWIAYSSWLGPLGGSAISIIASSGGSSRQITPAGTQRCRHPQWLDSERIVYSGVGEKGIPGVYVVKRDGTGNRILFRGEVVSPPQVNPDTAQICFSGIPSDATGKRPPRLIVVNEHGDRILGPFGRIFLNRWRL